MKKRRQHRHFQPNEGLELTRVTRHGRLSSKHWKFNIFADNDVAIDIENRFHVVALSKHIYSMNGKNSYINENKYKIHKRN